MAAAAAVAKRRPSVRGDHRIVVLLWKRCAAPQALKLSGLTIGVATCQRGLKGAKKGGAVLKENARTGRCCWLGRIVLKVLPCLWAGGRRWPPCQQNAPRRKLVCSSCCCQCFLFLLECAGGSFRVCLCVCLRERERQSERVGIYVTARICTGVPRAACRSSERRCVGSELLLLLLLATRRPRGGGSGRRRCDRRRRGRRGLCPLVPAGRAVAARECVLR